MWEEGLSIMAWEACMWAGQVGFHYWPGEDCYMCVPVCVPACVRACVEDRLPRKVFEVSLAGARSVAEDVRVEYLKLKQGHRQIEGLS